MQVHTVGGGQEYTLHVHRRLVVVLNLLCDNDKLKVNAGMPGKSQSGIGIVAGSQLRQHSGIRASPLPLVTD